MKGVYKIGKPRPKLTAVNQATNRNQRLNKTNFYFLMGILTALVFFVIFMNLMVYSFSS